MSSQDFATGLILGLTIILGGCVQEQDKEPPSTIKVGVLPDESPEALESRYAPLLAYLSEELDTNFELVIPRSYDDLLDIFGAGDVDMANLGGVTFVISHEMYQSEALVMRDVDLNFTTYYVARPESPGTSFADFEGRTIAFGSERSTSGHFMPRSFMLESGIVPETYFGDVAYSGAHDRTARMVRDGRAELGAVNSEVIRAMLRDGRLSADDIRIVDESSPYADYVWAIQPGFNEAFEIRLRDAFLALSPAVERHAEILGRLGAGGFLPASYGDFVRLNDAMDHVYGIEHHRDAEPSQ